MPFNLFFFLLNISNRQPYDIKTPRVNRNGELINNTNFIETFIT